MLLSVPPLGRNSSARRHAEIVAALISARDLYEPGNETAAATGFTFATTLTAVSQQPREERLELLRYVLTQKAEAERNVARVEAETKRRLDEATREVADLSVVASMIEDLTHRTGGVRGDEDVGAEAAEDHALTEVWKNIIHDAPSAMAAIERLFEAGWTGLYIDMRKEFADARIDVSKGAVDTAFHRLRLAGKIEKRNDSTYALAEMKEDDTTRR